MNVIIFSIISMMIGYGLFKLILFGKMLRRIHYYGRKLPGPPGVPIFGNALTVGRLQRNQLKNFFVSEMEKMVAQGENIMRLWYGHQLMVIPLDGSTVKDILESSTEHKKSRGYEFMLPWLGTGLLISTGPKWKSRRRLLTPTFHFNMLKGYVEVFDKQCRTLISIMKEHDGKVVDVFPLIKLCALDIILETAMGTTINAQKLKNHPYVAAVTSMGPMTRDYTVKPWLWFPPIWYLGGYHADYMNTIKTLTDFTKNIIEEREEAYKRNNTVTTGRKAFLDMLIDMKETSGFSTEDIREEVDTFMFEGHDTTSAGAAWILWCIASHPEIQQKVVAELFEVFGDTDRDCTVDDMARLPYLERVIKESIRMRPPVPIVSRVLQNDLQMGGHTLPAGAHIMIMPVLIHHNEKNWPSHNVFDPDRFLQENLIGRNAYDYIPFSAGPRNCIGQKFALYEEKVLVSWILRQFEIKATRPFLDNTALPEIILRPENGVPLLLTKRNWSIV